MGKKKLFELEPMFDQEVCKWLLGSRANRSLMERTFVNACLVEVNGSVNNLLLFAETCRPARRVFSLLQNDLKKCFKIKTLVSHQIQAVAMGFDPTQPIRYSEGRYDAKPKARLCLSKVKRTFVYN